MTDVNPYAAPASAVADAGTQEFGEIRILAAGGRLGRIRYIGYSVGIYLLAGLLAAAAVALATMLPETAGGIAMIIGAGLALLVAGVISVLLTIQRLHDVGWTGWLVLLLLIPYLGSLFSLLLWFIPGTRGPNRFGPVPPPNGKGATVLVLLVPLVALIGVIAVIAVPAYQDYVQRAQGIGTQVRER